MVRQRLLLGSCLSAIVLFSLAGTAWAQNAQAPRGATIAPPTQTVFAERQGPSSLMQSLYATTILVQTLDAHSTFRALDLGARESNPFVGSLAGNRTGFLALKVGIATASIYAAHSMARRNRVAAIAALVAVNTGYALIVRSNYHVAAVMRANTGGR